MDTSSDLLLSMVVGSAVAITIFSVRHRSHFLEPHLYGAARCGFYYMPGAFLSICRALLTQIDYHIDMTDAIFLPLTRAWGGEGYDEAVGEAQS